MEGDDQRPRDPDHTGPRHHRSPHRFIRITIPILLLHLLAFLLLVISFSFSLAALKSRQWVTLATFTSDSRTTSAGIWSRGPGGGFVPSADPPYTLTRYDERCGDVYDDDDWFCQQLDVWINALVAGVVLEGLAMVMALTLVVAGMLVRARVRNLDGRAWWRRRERARAADEINRDMMVVGAFAAATMMFLVLALVATVLGSVKLLGLLVNYQNPDASYVDGRGNIDLTQSHWMWNSPDAQYAAVAWLPALVALVLYFPGIMLGEKWVEEGGHED
ncbi:hypothetical protein BKA56DRAFT_626259 [Ilyonectria sp. MPI-CAGE-AT-0026]|nr:hypothetical protein BKA56DRAFT_626259 [Ilyonectria sp. MPI-CAGE-AT-0026]